MSGLTSQPSLGAIVAALEGTDRETGLQFDKIQAINSYWEQVRLLYSCFDPGLKSGDSGVYLHEMPGGQYTNLLFQSQQLGLGDAWIGMLSVWSILDARTCAEEMVTEVKKAYATANKLCGDIVKVTPSSKVVGDLAQFMVGFVIVPCMVRVNSDELSGKVSQKLTEQDVIDRAEELSFPTSVLEYYQGYLGEPPYGFPEPLRTRILEAKGLQKVEGRPGASMPPLDLEGLKGDLLEEYGEKSVRDVDVISAALYPKVLSH